MEFQFYGIEHTEPQVPVFLYLFTGKDIEPTIFFEAIIATLLSFHINVKCTELTLLIFRFFQLLGTDVPQRTFKTAVLVEVFENAVTL